MSVTTQISQGQNIVDVCLQELGSVEALFDLADANGRAITDALTPGAVLTVPASASAAAEVVSYYAGRHQRLNTGEVPSSPELLGRYFSPDYFTADYFG